VARSYGDRVDDTTPGLPGVDPIAYDELRARFEQRFGVAWDPAWNEPGPIPLDGRVQDARMEDYVALVLPGGSGSQFLRYDGTYEDLPGPAEDPEHVSPAADMATAAAALNDLVVAALVQGSPVLAVCHAAPNPAFARVPGTEGQGPDGLGRSVLQGRRATGFPLEIEVFGAVGDVAVQYAALGIEFVPEQGVVVDGPAVDLDGDGSPDGAELLVTGRSWYPEEVVEGVAALLDRLEP
jgi:putative intracellular protease/amidase